MGGVHENNSDGKGVGKKVPCHSSAPDLSVHGGIRDSQPRWEREQVRRKQPHDWKEVLQCEGAGE